MSDTVNGFVLKKVYDDYSKKIKTRKLSLSSKIKSFIPIYNIIDFLSIPDIEMFTKIVNTILFLCVSMFVSAIVSAPILLFFSFFTDADMPLYLNIFKSLTYLFSSLCFILGKNIFLNKLDDWKYDEILSEEDERIIRDEYGDEAIDLLLEEHFKKEKLTYRDLLYFKEMIDFMLNRYFTLKHKFEVFKEKR